MSEHVTIDGRVIITDDQGKVMGERQLTLNELREIDKRKIGHRWEDKNPSKSAEEVFARIEKDQLPRP